MRVEIELAALAALASLAAEVLAVLAVVFFFSASSTAQEELHLRYDL
jgi:hypothetical protein